MSAYANGETVRIPFTLYDASGNEVVDTTAGNYTWNVRKDGVLVSSPSFTIANPTGNELELVYTPSDNGRYTFGGLTHATTGYLTNVGPGGFTVRTNSIDTVTSQLASPVAAQSAVQAVAGDTLHLYRNKTFEVQFLLTDANGAARDLTGLTFRFAIGDRTEASDTAFYSQVGIAPDSPATAGLVTVKIEEGTGVGQTGSTPFDDRAGQSVWYELVEDDASDEVMRSLAPLIIHRDIPDA